MKNVELENLTLADIADYFREKYPKAVCVSLTVGFHNHELTVKEINYSKDSHFTMRTLDGTWAEANHD